MPKTNFPAGLSVGSDAAEVPGIVGIAGGRIAAGVAALDGSNPTPIVTGLTTITSFVATLQGSTAPGDNTDTLTATVSGGTASVYGWKNTGGTDPTLVASTGTEGFFWVAVGV